MTRMITTSLAAGCALAALSILPAQALQLQQPTEFYQAQGAKSSQWGRINGTPPAEGFIYQPPMGSFFFLPMVVAAPVLAPFGYPAPQPVYSSRYGYGERELVVPARRRYYR